MWKSRHQAHSAVAQREGKGNGPVEEQVKKERRGKGFATVIFSAALFGLMPLFARLVYANGGNPLSVVFYRFALALIPAFLFLKLKGISLKLSRKDALRISLLSVCGYGGTAFLLFTSYNFIPTGMATTIHFTYPVFVILGSILFLREKAEPLKLVCVALCMGGILLFYQGGAEGSVTGILLAFLSGITYTFYILYLDRGGIAQIPMMKLIFYMNLCSSIVLFLIGAASGEMTVGLTGRGWACMAFLSIALCLTAVWLFQIGVGKVGPQNAAILSTFEPLTSLTAGALFFQETFTLRSLAGSGLILISVIIVACIRRPEAGEESPEHV